MATASIRQVIFSPAEFFKQSTSVAGRVVLLDHDLGRLDISDDGAKLTVEIGSVQLGETIQMGCRVLVTGRVKKQQRRTFLEAQHIVYMVPPEEQGIEDSSTEDLTA